MTIYNFEMTTDARSEMPEVALYLRDRAMSDDDFSDLENQPGMPAGFEATPMKDAADRRKGTTGGGQ